MKIVLDTNLLIDGSSDVYNYGSRIVDEVLSGKLQAFANRATLGENRLIARQKISDKNYLNKLNSFFDCVNLVETRNYLDVVEDHDDNKILESAVESDSDYLITSDNHLLKLGQYENVKIIPPSQFWGIYQEENGSGWANWIKDFIK